jgi:quercetin dioxygenase-like cupin family protein
MNEDRPRTYEVLGILLKFHAFPGDVQGKYCLVECAVPPGLGAPPNRHAGETEAFYMLEGTARFMIDGVERDVFAGDHVSIPDGALHAFSAIGDKPARMLIINSPGNMHEAFFTGIGKVLPDGTKDIPQPDGPPDLANVLSVAAEVGMKIEAPVPA